ncbi:MAG TPA: hypothetical protein VKB09_01130 [Thermomicrobiales bacterium]|nr:hypothetical protein [Thermomicrobiales bacterium]
MSYDPHGVRDIPIGTPVIALNGSLLGLVCEVYPHYLLVGEEGQHGDLEVPVHAIQGLVDGKLQVSVNREAITPVDDEETAHRMKGEPG